MKAISTATATRDGGEKNDEGERTARLWERFVADNDPLIREQLILQYRPLVKYVMGRMAISLPAILEYQDVIASGTIGLIEAVERFDPTKGVKFETYAISRIRGSMIDMLRALDIVPRSARKKARETLNTASQLTVELGREPTDSEVATALGLTVRQYLKQLADASRVTISLDSMGASSEDDDDPSAVSVADPHVPEVTTDLERDEEIHELSAAIRELDERDQAVLSLYYKEELTLRQVSRVLGISESRVCQLHARALLRIRASLERRQTLAA